MLPADQAARLDSDGFLFVPADGVWRFDPRSRPRPVGDLTTSPSSYVLLAPGGVGKTVTFEGLSGAEHDARYIDLTVTERGELKLEIESAIADGVPVYLDALDQAALYEPSLYRLLKQQLTGPDARSNAWRLACRPAAWTASLTSALKEHLPAFQQFKLLPMDRFTAQDAVTSAGFDGPEFMDALVRANLGRLSAIPQWLIATARHWHARGALPDSHLAAIKFEVRQFLKETDDGRPRQLPADRAARVAKRLGAITTFAGVRRITMATTGDDYVTSVDDLPSSPEPDEPGTIVGTAEYGEVLGTALFEAGPSGALTFRHQQYAEYLAASYLADRGITAAQLPALLGVHPNGLLPGTTVGVAAWLAAVRPALVTGLIADNARAFAAAGVELPSTQTRAAVVDGLLRQAARAELGPEWGLDLLGLAHPGLDEQLTSHLERGFESSEQLWWAVRLAVTGECKRLAPLLARYALDPTWAPSARCAAVKAVRELGHETVRRSLRNLLALDPTEDSDDELLAAAIDALYPQMLTTEELFPVLRAPQSPDLLGGYWVTLQELAERIPIDDLPSFLDWFAAQTHDVDSSEPFGQLFFGLVRRAWTEAHSVTVRTALANLLSSSVHSDRWLLHQYRRDKPPWVDGDATLRQMLAVAVAQSVSTDAWYTLLPLGLLAADDVVWLIDQLPSLSPHVSTVLGRCLPQLLHEPTAEIVNRILNLDPSHPAYGPTDVLRQPVDLNTSPAVQWRQQSTAELEFRQQRSKDREQLRTGLAAALDRAVSDPSTWWKVTLLISFGGEGHATQRMFTHDLTRRPGWMLLSATEQEWVLDDGLNYLRTHQLNPADWRQMESVAVDQVLPDWSGVYLMTTLIRHSPEKIRALESAVWDRWAPAIVAAWNTDHDEDTDLRRELVRSAPTQAREKITKAALDHLDTLDAVGKHLSPHPLYEHLTKELAPEVAQRLLAGRYTSGIGHELLNLMTQHAPATALLACRELKGNPESSLSTEAVYHLAALDPNGTVDDLATTHHSTAELAEIARHLRVPALDHAHLALAGRLLLDAFSYDDDPPLQSGFHSRDATDQAREIRAEVLRQLAVLGHTQTLVELRQGRPPIDRKALSRFEGTARTREADLALEPPTPEGLLDLLRRSDSRLIRNDADLLNVVLEHLDQLQHKITNKGAFRDVWNNTHPKSEDDISDWIQRWLEELLKRGVVIDREIQVQRSKQGGIGNRIDLAATAPTETQPRSTARVIIEAKLISNRDLMTAMHKQLVQRYLVPSGLRHGIYLVYWVTPDQRPTRWSRTNHANRDDLQDQLARQASAAPSGSLIRPYILDISQPAP